jgi:hypothetical protein
MFDSKSSKLKAYYNHKLIESTQKLEEALSLRLSQKLEKHAEAFKSLQKLSEFRKKFSRTLPRNRFQAIFWFSIQTFKLCQRCVNFLQVVKHQQTASIPLIPLNPSSSIQALKHILNAHHASHRTIMFTPCLPDVVRCLVCEHTRHLMRNGKEINTATNGQTSKQ